MDNGDLNLQKLFESIGLTAATVKGALKSTKFKNVLHEVIAEADALETGCNKEKGNLLYTVAGKWNLPESALAHRQVLVDCIMDGRIKTNPQVVAALEFLRKANNHAFSVPDFERACGVGVVVSEAQITEAVESIMDKNKDELVSRRYQFTISGLLPDIRNFTDLMQWADMKLVKAELDKQVLELLGPKTEQDEKPTAKQPKQSLKKETPATNSDVQNKEPEQELPSDPWAFLSKPEENTMVHTTVHFSEEAQAGGEPPKLSITNTPEQLQKHLKATSGKVITRFPPEPNGYLHIGHAKAMFIDFGMSRQYGGECYLRYDDTNPDAEKDEYIQHIKEIVSWLGWTPTKVTYSCDYFQELYDLAVQLIKAGYAYVDHQSPEQITEFRKEKMASPWRERPIRESLKLFDDMRRGLVDEGEATLRMKMDYKNEVFCMFDLIAYRVKFTEHPHGGDKWCVYPSYDYTHCIVDSLENVTHSMCTLEFEARRNSYFWLLEKLNLYKPVVWEYSRLNITHNVLSKRKLNALVTDGHVDGWDDPRLLTLSGMRRRGVLPESINNFCREIGITRSDQLMPIHKLEYHIRTILNDTSPRVLAVLRPIKLVLANVPDDFCKQCEAHTFPGWEKDSIYKVPLTKTVYIEQSDFREKKDKGFFGLCPEQSVMLKYAGIVKVKDVDKDSNGNIVQINVDFEEYKADSGIKLPKGILHWVSCPAPGKPPHPMKVRLYSELFKSENPNEVDDWLADFNKESLEICENGIASPLLAAAQPGDKFQFERTGYFCVDTDTTQHCLVVNRTVTLRETLSNKFIKT